MKCYKFSKWIIVSNRRQAKWNIESEHAEYYETSADQATIFNFVRRRVIK